MAEYFWVGLRLLVVGMVVLVLLRSAPARWRVCVCLAGLFATVFPWYLMPSLHLDVLANVGEMRTPTMIIEVLAGINIPSASSSFLGWWILVFMLLGAIGFIVVVTRQTKRLGHWRAIAHSRDDLLTMVPVGMRKECRVWVLPNSKEAGATQLITPEIWIGDYFLNDRKLQTVVTHEFVHVQAGDLKTEWFLTLARCVFWWHPLVWVWVWRARREIEIACDERCADVFGQREYQANLAELIGELSIFQGGVAMTNGKSFNLTRLKKLARKPRLLSWHRALIPVAFLVAILNVVNLQASAPSESAAGGQQVTFTLCPVDVEAVSLKTNDQHTRLSMTLSDSAAARLKSKTESAVGSRLLLVDGHGSSLQQISLTIRAPLHKNVQLVLDSESGAKQLHRYLEGDSCDYR